MPSFARIAGTSLLIVLPNAIESGSNLSDNARKIDYLKKKIKKLEQFFFEKIINKTKKIIQESLILNSTKVHEHDHCL